MSIKAVLSLSPLMRRGSPGLPASQIDGIFNLFME